MKKLGKFYQSININGKLTDDRNMSNEKLWKRIRKVLPEDLNGLRILDLGCNAGLHSCMAALEGANVIGVNRKQESFKYIKENHWVNQAKFVKDYFENKYNKELDVTYIWEDISDVDFESLGRFDYVLAISVLYHVGNSKYKKHSEEALMEQIRVIKSIDCDNWIVRTRANEYEYENLEYFDKTFNDLDFQRTKGDYGNGRRLVLYQKL